MLTIKTYQQSVRQMNDYGEGSRGALNHLADRVIGSSESTFNLEAVQNTPSSPSPDSLVWDSKLGVYLLAKYQDEDKS